MAATFLSRILCILALQARKKHKEKMILFAFYTFSTHNIYSQSKIPSGRRSLLSLLLLLFSLSLLPTHSAVVVVVVAVVRHHCKYHRVYIIYIRLKEST